MKRVNIKLSDETHKQAKITAINQNITLQDYLRILIEIGMNKKEK